MENIKFIFTEILNDSFCEGKQFYHFEKVEYKMMCHFLFTQLVWLNFQSSPRISQNQGPRFLSNMSSVFGYSLVLFQFLERTSINKLTIHKMSIYKVLTLSEKNYSTLIVTSSIIYLEIFVTNFQANYFFSLNDFTQVTMLDSIRPDPSYARKLCISPPKRSKTFLNISHCGYVFLGCR